MKKKYNCWEIKKCAREPGGVHEKDMGACPAAVTMEANTINGGVNGGRCCWVVAGTYCYGEVAGSVAQKIDNCQECAFYQKVWKEEGGDFKMTAEIREHLKRQKREK